MQSLSRIEPSAFRRGEYVGYCNGVWFITRSALTRSWLAVKGKALVSARTLAQLNDKFDALEAQRLKEMARG